MTVYKPSTAEFKTVVANYANNVATHAETFAIVELCTTYYQSKFFGAVYSSKAVA